jgi:hypothetical protein
MVYFGKFMSWPVGKCPNMERSDLFSLLGQQKRIAQVIAGHLVVCGHILEKLWSFSSKSRNYTFKCT